MYPLLPLTRTSSDTLSRRNPPTNDEPHDFNELSASALLRRQQRQEPPSYSRPPPSQRSSSSGSSRTLRRTPRFASRRTLRSRASPFSTTRPQSPPAQFAQAFAELASLRSDGSTTSLGDAPDSTSSPFWPVRSGGISRRTHSAILYALEIALRGPRAFTIDPVEDQAQMSDLASGAVFGNGRAQNGGSRAASGPQPVPQVGSQYRSTSGVRTPTDIMRQRREREIRRREEAAKQQSGEDTQAPIEREDYTTTVTRRRADAAGRGNEERRRSRKSDPTVPVTNTEGRLRNSGGEPRTAPVINEPPTYAATDPRREKQYRNEADLQQAANNRPRGSTLEPPAKPLPRTERRAVSAGHTPQQAPQPAQASNIAVNSQATSNAAQVSSKMPPPSQRQPLSNGTANPRSNTSSFPHAFERWETLSSHWEGLTSYWIRRLQANSDESGREPLNQQMARQVTDLSAAGANLFHAVVELQRLRASSERKFQRWFFEQRNEQERAHEIQAGLEKQLQAEKQARQAAEAELAQLQNERLDTSQISGAAEQMLKEKNRELQISKEEARRAWEELGRREQEERDRTASLRNGEPTLVGGVQVLPMPAAGGFGRDDTSNRPVTRDGPPPAAPVAPLSRSNDPGYTNYDPNRSETGTDPVSDIPRPLAMSGQAPQQTSNAAAAAMQATRGPSQSSPARGMDPSAAATQARTYLNYGPSGATTQQQPSSFYQHEGSSLFHEDHRPATTEADQQSYVQSNEDTFSEEEYAYDDNGQIKRNSRGDLMMFRGAQRSENSDEFDVQEDLDRERMYGQRYGSSMSGVEYGSGPTGVPAQINPTTQVDYSGRGYGPAPWEQVPRHHHPTRLSDVLEEDERSRTSPSRASQTSRGVR